MRRLKILRAFTITVLALLALQYEMGMSVNLSPALQDVQPMHASIPAMWRALVAVGGVAASHALFGTLLTLVTLAGFVLALFSRARSVIVLGALCFVTICLAALSGVLFTLSGFQNDGFSHGMATNFLTTFSFQFIQLCVVSVRIKGAKSAAA